MFGKPNGPFKVLIVDDSVDDRFFLQQTLARNPNFVIVGEACDGQEAIDYLQRSSNFPDLVFLDLKMPRKTGFDVLKWIQIMKLSSITLIVLSGSHLTEDINQSLALGAHAYFKKSSSKIERDSIISEVEKLLYKRHTTCSDSHK